MASVRISIRGLESQSIHNQGVLKILPLLEFVLSQKKIIVFDDCKSDVAKIRVQGLDKLSNTLDLQMAYIVSSHILTVAHMDI